ncbi:MAG: 1-acyl-sn-glycerol-3-phosphate acyltransferase [Treponema sp.]|nr:1-acyl-sn-glycerol-3-phosphate acyltransferase [Treponema sp.]
MRKALVFMQTVLIFVPVVGAMIVLIPLGFMVFVLSIAGLQKPMSMLMYRAAQGWAHFMLFCTGCKLSVSGRENIPKKGGLCFVSNHGSIFDIVLHLAYAGRPIGFIAKKELAYIPLLNMWIYLLGGLFLNRGNMRSAVRTINKGIKRIKDGRAMIIFPEGRRSRGQGLLPFHPGSLRLATEAEAPIVPIALAGSYDVFERYYRLNPGPVKVVFGKVIPTAGLSGDEKKRVLADRVRNVIAEALGGAAGPALEETAETFPAVQDP